MLLLSLSANAAPLPGIPEVTHREFNFTSGQRVVIRNTAGRITIGISDRDRMIVSATRRTGGEGCAFSADKSVDLTEVAVTVTAPKGQPCEIDLDVKVPAKINLNVSSDTGAVHVAGVQGELTFGIGTGAMVANGRFKRVEGKSGSGDVEIEGLEGAGRLEVGTGSLNLKFLGAPTGDMEVRTGTGDAIFSIPKDSKLNASLTSGTGGVENEFQSSTGGDFNLNAKTGTGDLKVKAY